ncbi:hypothetical protein N7516_010108 [Penicillium verrucosum]|uniref:uncharacterized protein n=1 Tax=Penicillium verrucosum TaxID=60171 RepID=UPI0025456E64|nr:uncharacterized protein N7516_010108 [Penicillium verrucosum]KAJ5922405.1 hypothetical protein N7516_010108 [Penicillium verrucosum]
MHRKFGPVVRITPDEVHIREPFGTSSYSDDWIKGTRELESGHYQGRSVHGFQYKKPSISRARSLLRVEVNHIINTLIEKHQVHRMFSSRRDKKVQPVGSTLITPTSSRILDSGLQGGVNQSSRMNGFRD